MNDELDMRPTSAASVRELLLEEARSEPSRVTRRRRRRLFTISLASVGFVIVTATAGVAIIGAQKLDEQSFVHCFAEARFNADGSYAGSAVSVSGRRVATSQQALDACIPVWQQGVFDDGFDPMTNTADSTNHPVPDLTVCVMHDGSAAVVPGRRTVCETLGLAPAAG